MKYDNDYAEDGKSRSRKKRESAALQKHGEEIAELSTALRKSLPLPPDLDAAFAELETMKSREARRRHLQYIGRLMREMDDEERDSLLAALERLRLSSHAARADLKRVEAMRESLLQPEEKGRQQALAECLAACPSLDEARLMHLMQAAVAEREKKRPPRHARELFRYLRDACGGEA